MEYVYAAAILNELDQEINEENLKAVLTAAGADVSESRVKALVAALEDVDIDERIASATPGLAGEGPAGSIEGRDEESGEVEESDETMPQPADEDAEAGDEDEEEEDDGTDLGGLFS